MIYDFVKRKIIITFEQLQTYNTITMKTGKVKFFNENKGFGFIVEDESNQEVFVHSSGLVDRVRENDQVEYEVTEGKKGLNAINVKKVQ